MTTALQHARVVLTGGYLIPSENLVRWWNDEKALNEASKISDGLGVGCVELESVLLKKFGFKENTRERVYTVDPLIVTSSEGEEKLYGFIPCTQRKLEILEERLHYSVLEEPGPDIEYCAQLKQWMESEECGLNFDANGVRWFTRRWLA